MDSNYRYLVYEATALPTEPHHCPSKQRASGWYPPCSNIFLVCLTMVDKAIFICENCEGSLGRHYCMT